MRQVLLLFYTLETFLNMMLVYVHVEGFIKQPMDFLPIISRITHYFYTSSFYIFTAATIWASTSVTTGHIYYTSEEIIRSFVGFLLYTIISLMTLNNAEKDFHLMYMVIDESHAKELLHPFFQFMRFQAVLAIVTAVIYLLHCVIVIDVVLCGLIQKADNVRHFDVHVEYKPVHVYLLSKQLETYLEQYKWFLEFKHGAHMSI